LALGAGAAAFGQKATAGGAAAAQADGGLAVSSGTIDAAAKAGAYGPVKVSNRSATALTVTVAPRQWTQAANGKVSPNRRGGLAGVSVSAPSFTLAPGEERDLTVNVASIPAAGSLYGALEVVGLPSDLTQSHGVVAGYRLVSSLRYTAATATYGLKAGAAKVSGTGAKRTLTLSVRNTGNTIAPVTGTVKLKGALGTNNGALKSTRILPGKTVAVSLASLSSVRAGNYAATVTLIQNKQKTKVTRNVRVR